MPARAPRRLRSVSAARAGGRRAVRQREVAVGRDFVDIVAKDTPGDQGDESQTLHLTFFADGEEAAGCTYRFTITDSGGHATDAIDPTPAVAARRLRRPGPGSQNNLLLVDSTWVPARRAVKRSVIPPCEMPPITAGAPAKPLSLGFRPNALFAPDGTPNTLQLTSPKADEHRRRRDGPGPRPHLAPICRRIESHEHRLDLQRHPHLRTPLRTNPRRTVRTRAAAHGLPRRRRRAQPPARSPKTSTRQLLRLIARNQPSSPRQGGIASRRVRRSFRAMSSVRGITPDSGVKVYATAVIWRTVGSMAALAVVARGFRSPRNGANVFAVAVAAVAVQQLLGRGASQTDDARSRVGTIQRFFDRLVSYLLSQRTRCVAERLRPAGAAEMWSGYQAAYPEDLGYLVSIADRYLTIGDYDGLAKCLEPFARFEAEIEASELLAQIHAHPVSNKSTAVVRQATLAVS